VTHLEFKKLIWNWYTENRRELPWRPPTTRKKKHLDGYSFFASSPQTDLWAQEHAYEIFISEIMLQQTQVDRVIPFFETFITELPDWEALANCPQPKLLKLWKGLGYNRRALNTKKAAQYILEHHNGKLPQDLTELQKIPNVGVYTSAAIMNFVHGIPTPLIETNVRTVFFHHFYTKRDSIDDTTLMKKVLATLDLSSPRNPGHPLESLQRSSPREWMYALMDYGSHLRREGIKITNKSKHYTKQKSFKGSKREIRGKILEILLHDPVLSPEILEQKISDDLPDNENNIQHVIEDMVKEGFLEKSGQEITIKDRE
jgi:A/G-specific adenine glycosylase